MTVLVYGDITVDNYEHERIAGYSETYLKGLGVKTDPYPGLSKRMRNRFVARKFGGAYLLARNIAIALTAWNKCHVDDAPPEFDPNTTTKGLHQLPPWSDHWEKFNTMEEELIRNPANHENVLNLFYRLSKDPDDGSYRIHPGGYEGFTLPNRRRKGQDIFRCLLADPVVLRNADGKDTVSLCVLNDGGTALRHPDTTWLESQPWVEPSSQGRTWAIVKTHEPEFITGNLEIQSQPSYLKKLISLLGNRVVLVLTAEDLRRSGVVISRSLAWELSVKDVISQIRQGALGSDLPSHIVITFGFDAAMYLHRPALAIEATAKSTEERVILVFSTHRSEGEYQSGFHGSMPGSQTVFTSVFASLVYTYFSEHPTAGLADSDDLMERILTYALIAKQRMLRCGFQPVTDSNMFRPGRDIGDGVSLLIPTLMYHEAVFGLPPPRTANADEREDMQQPTAVMPSERRPEDQFSYPLGRDKSQLRRDQGEHQLSCVALDSAWLHSQSFGSFEIFDVWSERFSDPLNAFVGYVKYGKINIDGEGLALPICNIGKIKTISAREIDGLRSIRLLIATYIEDDSTTPLGLAVFGEPGTGKSFTIRSIFETFKGDVGRLMAQSFIECNLSGLRDTEDLASYFQRARDRRLEGKVPVLFFDEFDCTVGTQRYFWLKHFLAHLQDGVFTSGHTTHPLGKAIFVFAGSTKSSFKDFKSQFVKDEQPNRETASGKENKEAWIKEDREALKYVKGRDFVSRLQGHIDIEGLGLMVEGAGEAENRRVYMRRAILLREILKKRARSIVDDRTEELSIDDNVVKTFLEEKEYLHGVRSIEAIIRMSAIGRRFTPECLPTKEQLEMHVSADFYGKALRRGR